MVPSVTPTTTPHAYENIFREAFTAARHRRFAPVTSVDQAPNKACGDPIDPNFTGLYIRSNNVNTLSLTNDLADLHKLCRHFQANNIGIAALQELNIDMSQASIYQRVKAVFDEHFDKQCTMICSTTHIRSATHWKLGSTLLVIFPTWTPYIVARQRDDLGRWCSVTLEVHDRRQLVFYSFYNCCKTKIEQAGIHTIFAQQWHAVLRARGDRAPDPRLQAVTDLADELAVHKRHSRSICIMGDFNEEIGTDPALMAAVCSSNDLVNVMDVRHPDDRFIPSYARSSNRLDYALVSNDLVPYIAGAGLNHYHEFYPTNHRPIFIGLDNRLFGLLPPRPITASGMSTVTRRWWASLSI
jgi:hypothetical protein